jgi:hypothetical protein
VRDRPAEGGQSQPRRDAEHLERAHRRGVR